MPDSDLALSPFRRNVRTIRGTLVALGRTHDDERDDDTDAAADAARLIRATPSLEELVLASRSHAAHGASAHAEGDAIAAYNPPPIRRRYGDAEHALLLQRADGAVGDVGQGEAEGKLGRAKHASRGASRQPDSAATPPGSRLRASCAGPGGARVGAHAGAVRGELSPEGTAFASPSARAPEQPQRMLPSLDAYYSTLRTVQRPRLGRAGGAAAEPGARRVDMHDMDGARADREVFPVVLSRFTEGLRGSELDEEYRYVAPSLQPHRRVASSVLRAKIASSSSDASDLLARAQALASAGDHATAAATYLRGVRDGAQALQQHAARGFERELQHLRFYARPVAALGRGAPHARAADATGGDGSDSSDSVTPSERDAYGSDDDERRGATRRGTRGAAAARRAALPPAVAAATAAARELAASRNDRAAAGGARARRASVRHAHDSTEQAIALARSPPPRIGKPLFANDAASARAFEDALAQLDIADLLSGQPAEREMHRRAAANALRGWRRELARLMREFAVADALRAAHGYRHEMRQRSVRECRDAAAAARREEAARVTVEYALHGDDGSMLRWREPEPPTAARAPPLSTGRRASLAARRASTMTWSNAARSHDRLYTLALDEFVALVRAIGVRREHAADEILTVTFVRAHWARGEAALRAGDATAGLVLHELLGALCRLANFRYRYRTHLSIGKRVGRFMRRFIGTCARAESDEPHDGVIAGLRDTLDGDECENLYYAYKSELVPLFELYAHRGARLAARMPRQAGRALGARHNSPLAVAPSATSQPLGAATAAAASDGELRPDEPSGDTALDWEDISNSSDASFAVGRIAADATRARAPARGVGAADDCEELRMSATDWLELWRCADLVIGAREQKALAETSLNPRAWAALRDEHARLGTHVRVGLVQLEVQAVFVEAQLVESAVGHAEAAAAAAAVSMLSDAALSYDEFWEGIARFAARLPAYAWEPISERVVKLARAPPSGALAGPLAARTHMLLQLLLHTWRKEDRRRALNSSLGAPAGSARQHARFVRIARHLEGAPARAVLLLAQYSAASGARVGG
ncbi:hypothetical protein KFE25_000953 [Diacronema lutheri]|uniref:Uncharacterized protein n=1 Tax=Diacronema lutheri TaxID=2081491 RepID=A0A8J5XAC1_DIALT|nr:hypothetical protein KFE25_000953 [Diacronema lutheri]